MKKRFIRFITLTAVVTALICMFLCIGVAADVSEPKVITANDLEWVVPPEGIIKVYDGLTQIDPAFSGVQVQIKAGVVGTSPVAVSGKYNLVSPNVGEGNKVVFTCDTYYDIANNYVIPAGISLTHDAMVFSNQSGTLSYFFWLETSKTYDGLPATYPDVIASNGATQEQMTFIWKDESNETVDVPYLPGTYTLYINVPNLENGIGIDNYCAGQYIISEHVVHSFIPAELFIEKTHFTLSHIAKLVEADREELLVEGDEISVNITHHENCTYLLTYKIMRGNVDVTSGYSFTPGNNLYINIHFGTRWNDEHFCDTCYLKTGNLGPVNGNVFFANSNANQNFFSEKADDFSPFYNDPNDTFAVTQIYASFDIVLQRLISDRLMTLSELKTSNAWTLVEPNTEFDFGTNIESYVYFRWFSLDGKQGGYFALPHRFITDNISPVPPPINNYETFLGDATLTVTDNYGIKSILIYAQYRNTDDKLFNKDMEEHKFDYKSGELVTTHTFTLPFPDFEFTEFYYDIFIEDISGNSVNFPVYMVPVSNLSRSASKLTVDTVLDSSKDTLLSERNMLINAKGTLSEKVRAERDAAVAHIDTLLAKIEENKTAEKALYAEADALRKEFDAKLPTLAVISISVGTVVLLETAAFAIIWFAVKRKKWNDFIGIFKK